MKKSSGKIPDRRVFRSAESQVARPVASMMNQRSRKIIKRQRYLASRMPYNPRLATSCGGNQDLVEIYHNSAVKESRSSESDVPKKRLLQKQKEEHKVEPQVVPEAPPEVVPPLNMNATGDQEPQSLMSTMLSRNYEMPTISSRMKQVAKYYMNSFNIKTIPFCPATSTGPSHNIGINIQQVMSMVKTKQPVQKLSPTLAYNIGLAAGRWNTSPLSFLVSSMTSRV